MDFLFGTWNTRSLNKPGNSQTLVEELLKYKLQLVALQEIRWMGTGSVKIGDGHILYGDCGDTHELGTGFFVHNAIFHAVKDFKSVNNRITILTIEAQWFDITFINVHAPTEEKCDAIKEEFYNELEKIYSELPARNIKVVLGDLNAKLGRENIYREVIGKESLHNTTNKNGTYFINFAIENNIVVSSTRFPHKNIHKGTWISPGGRAVNQIDHIAIQKRFVNSIIDVRSCRGADCDSDHILVKAKMRIKLKKIKRQEKRNIIYDLESLKEPEIQAKYISELEQSLSMEPQSQMQDDIEANWKNCKENVQKVTKKVLQSKKKKDRVWFNTECREGVEKRRTARQLWLGNMENEILKEDFFRIKRDVQKLLRQKKRDHYNKILEDAEDDFQHHRSRQMYQNIKKTSQKYKKRETFVKDKEGNIITNEERVSSRWAEYFSELLNAEEPAETFVFNFPDTADNDVPPPSLDEVQEIINKLKNHKAGGEDQIFAELIKNGGSELVARIGNLLNLCWNQEQIPEEWKISLITPIHKKNDSLNCNNYRGIALLNITYKILSLILLKRIHPLSEDLINEYQYGFRTGRSTVDQIFTLRQICEKAWEYNKKAHILFIDFIKAYDSIHRKTLLNILKEFHFPQKLINLISMCINETYAKVKTSYMVSEKFIIHSGLRQGDPLSPVLFNLVLEKISRDFEKSLNREGFIMGNKKIVKLAYADDIGLMAETKGDLQEMVRNFGNLAAKVGLKISIEKSEYMCISRENDTSPLIVDDLIFKKVENFKYLGSILNHQNDKIQEITARINSANRAYFSLQKVFKKRSLSKNFKIRLYQTNILPVILYGSEALAFRTVDENKLLVFERKILRRIYGPILDPLTQQWRILKNREVYERYGSPNIIQVMKNRRLKYAGHVARMDELRTPRIALIEEVEGRKLQGRPKLRWINNIEKDVQEMRIDPETWIEAAQQRDVWRQAVEQTYGRPGPGHG